MWELMMAPGAACLLIAGIHCYFGLHVVARGVIFVDLAIAQIAVLGTVTAMSVGVPPGPPTFLASLALVVLAAAVFASGHFHREGVPQEALIGITYAVAAAATVLLLDRNPHGHDLLKQVMAGSVLFATWPDVLRMAAVYGAIGAFHFLFRRRFFALSRPAGGHEPAMAHRRLWDFLFYATFGLVVEFSVRTAGVLLVFTYLVVPASIAAFVARDNRVRLAIGWAAGALLSAAGLWLSVRWDMPTGALIVVVGGVAFALVAVLAQLRAAAPPPAGV